MMVPASGGIGAYHLALKLGVMGLFWLGAKILRLEPSRFKLCFLIAYTSTIYYVVYGANLYTTFGKSQKNIKAEHIFISDYI